MAAGYGAPRPKKPTRIQSARIPALSTTGRQRPPAADFLLNHQAEWPEAYTAQATKDDACMRAWCANGPSALTSIHHPQNTTDRPQRLSHVNHVAPSAENPAGLDLGFTLSY